MKLACVDLSQETPLTAHIEPFRFHPCRAQKGQERRAVVGLYLSADYADYKSDFWLGENDSSIDFVITHV